MAWRSGETPMDFEYDNGVGNLDRSEARSPFAKLASQQKAGTLDRNFGSSWKAATSPSPRKPAFDLPAVPQTPKAAPPSVFREQFSTDFSSAAESSPDGGHGADSEDTPEPRRIDNVTIFRGGSPHRGKTPPARRQSWLQRLRTSKPHTELMRKAHKRKRREVEREDRSMIAGDQRYNDGDSSRPSSADGPASPGSKQGSGSRKPTKEVGTVAAVLSFIHEHPRLPTILAFYGQCLFSFFILSMLGWMIWGMWSAVLQQIEVEAEALGQDALREIESCRRQWVDNRCEPAAAVPPALQDLCAGWDRCRNQDWRAKGRAKIGAHTFAQILNSFVEPLSYKLILLLLACLALLVMSPYTLFNPVRRAADEHFQQQQQQHRQQPQPPMASPWPQTPSRQMQNEWANAGALGAAAGGAGFATPMANRQWDNMDWGSPSKRMEGRSRSPVKQIEYQKFA